MDYPGLENLRKHLLHLHDSDLIVLKGHLLVEEQIIRLVKLNLVNSGNFKNLKNGFKHNVELLWCLSNLGADESSLKSSILQLNGIRNKIAHDLNYEDLEKDLGAWACKYLEHTPKTLHKNKKVFRNTTVRALASLIGLLCGIAEATELLKRDKKQG